ncbi:hypothetical protein KP509_24G011400 [Ceratopteris richardii]|uniref:Uncharacterized protein n=1 Tax=Ceratopteris richardii TaxID=49495 RepID=A0A8T2RVB1_CERRI|nr:hypothetical protein KP509_24G011400 [Ceratopteris richardii]
MKAADRAMISEIQVLNVEAVKNAQTQLVTERDSELRLPEEVDTERISSISLKNTTASTLEQKQNCEETRCLHGIRNTSISCCGRKVLENGKKIREILRLRKVKLNKISRLFRVDYSNPRTHPPRNN